MIKRISSIFILCSFLGQLMQAQKQALPDWNNLDVLQCNRLAPRATFFPF